MLSAFVFSTEDNNCKPMSVDVLKRAIKHGLDAILTFTDVLKGHKNLSLNAESEMKTYANARCLSPPFYIWTNLMEWCSEHNKIGFYVGLRCILYATRILLLCLVDWLPNTFHWNVSPLLLNFCFNCASKARREFIRAEFYINLLWMDCAYKRSGNLNFCSSIGRQAMKFIL